MTTLQSATHELKTELQMRRKVWRKVGGNQKLFIDPEHNRRYATMIDMLKVLESLGEKGWKEIVDKIEAAEAAKGEQAEMFT